MYTPSCVLLLSALLTIYSVQLVGNDYTTILAVFNVTFSVFDLPSNLLLKKFSGKYMLPAMMTGW